MHAYINLIYYSPNLFSEATTGSKWKGMHLNHTWQVMLWAILKAWRFWEDMRKASLAAGKPIGEGIFSAPHDESQSASENLGIKRWGLYFWYLHYVL